MSVLVLGGTAEARALAGAMAAAGMAGEVSLAGRTAAPLPHALPLRRGGFGGEAGFRAALAGRRALVDASHPFAAQISQRAARVCGALGLPLLRLERAPWRQGDLAEWDDIAAPEELPGLIAPGARILLATGPGEIGRYGGLAGRWLLCRRLEPTSDRFPHEGAWLVARPGADLQAEAALMRTHRIDWLVTKNAGGAGGAKLAAAAQEGVRIAMIRRPEAPDVARVESVEEAMAWLRAL